MYHKELCPFICLLALLAFNYPILSLAASNLPLYLYLSWGVLIMVVALVTTLRERRRRKMG
jgi:hypothetical protein